MLDSCYFVASRSIVLGDFGLYNDLGIELARDDEVWSLIEAFDPFCALCFPITDSCLGQNLFDRYFKCVSA